MNGWPALALSCAVLSASLSGAGEDFDLCGFIDSKSKSGEKRIVIPPGQYRVKPKKRCHLLLQDLRDVEIVAAGVEMICTETTRALTISNCRNLMLRGLTIDYDPLPFTQGRIVKLSEDGRVHEIKLFDGYPRSDNVEERKYAIFKSDTRTLRFGSYYDFKVEKLAPDRIRLTKVKYARKHPEQVGDTIVIGASDAPGGSIPHAIFIDRSKDLVLEDVTLYASNCFGYIESNCSNTTYRRCRVDRRPSETDIRKRADPRVRSLNADAFHSKHAVVGPKYIECSARFQGDDCIAINGDYHMVMAAEGATLRVMGKHGLNIKPGDPLEVVNYEGVRLPDAKAVSVKEIGKITDEERAFLSRQRMNERYKNGKANRVFEVVADRPLDLPRGSVIAAANRIGNGFKIINGRFGFNRSRGLIVKASHGEIIGNKLEGCEMHAIYLAPEFWWLEAGSSDGVVIRDNVITRCGSRPIAIVARGGRGKVAPAGAHNDITIVGNRIEKCPNPAIWVTSTKGLLLKGNTSEPLEGEGEKEAFDLVNCEGVKRN